MGRPLHILMIEDSEEDAQLLLRELQRSGYEVELARVETAEAMQSALTQKAWDLVLSDYSLPKFSALKALEVLKASGLDLPFIIISGTIGEDMAVTALKAGANDFLIKGNFARLGPAIERELREAESRRGRKQAIESLRQSEERYRTLFESNPHPMWVYDLETLRFLAVNEAAVLHYGYSQEEFRSMTIKGIRPAEDVPALMAKLTEIQQDLHTPSIWRHRKKDGTVIDVEVISHALQWKNRPARLVLANDITERKQAEEQVRAQATRLKLLADVSQAFASVVQDYDGMLDVVARQIAEVLGGFCGVRLLSDDGKWLEMMAMYDVDPEALELARMLSDQTPMRTDEPNFSQRILQSSQALLWPGISEDQLRAVVQPKHWANLKYVASQSRILAPMRVRGQAIGFLIISRKPGSPAFDEQDLRLAQDLADRAALAISNARLFKQVNHQAELLANVNDAIVASDAQYRLTVWNAAAQSLYGWKADEVLGRDGREILRTEYPTMDAEEMRRRIAETGRWRGEATQAHKDGRRIPVEVSSIVLRNESEQIYGYVSVIRDITERKQAQAAMLESEARYHRVLDAMMEGCQIIDFDWRFVYVNEVVAAQGKQRPEDLLNHTMMEIYPGIENTELFAVLRQCMEERTPRRMENQFVFQDGSTGWFELSIQPAREGIFILSTDITERKRAEVALRAKNEELKNMSQQLWQAAKLATMGELAASIAHELNNPLATISLRTEMLLAQFSTDAPQSRSLQIIDSEVERMSALVANLLEFSRRNSSQISTVDVRKELVNTLELVQYHLRKYNILTVQEFSPETPLAQVDRQQLRQVFLNLFTNAADAMPQGGTLTIRTWPGEKPALGLTAPLRRPVTASLGLPVSKLPQLLIEVSDTGEGIPPERLERVWEPFYTTKPEGKGTGLGLAICRRIIQEHGGTIEIISEGIPGKGITIRITLPAVKGR